MQTGNQSIRVVDVAASYVLTLAGPGSAITGNVNGQGAANRFNNPTGLAVDSDHQRIYIAVRRRAGSLLAACAHLGRVLPTQDEVNCLIR